MNPSPANNSEKPAVRVPYVDLAGQHKPLKAKLLKAVESVLDTGQFILGPQVAEFETQFAKLCCVKHAVGVANGTDALVLSLQALNIGPGDEVITAPNSFVASASAIGVVGATPVFVDVGPDYNLDPALLEQAITPRTRAIMPVHLTGRAADMDPINQIARKHALHVIEDSAQAVGAFYRGRPTGSLGTLGCFSLHPLKTLNACGDAGIITTDSQPLAQRLRILRNIGLQTRDNAVEWTGNSRLDSIQAAMLLVKLDHLQEWTDARRKNAAFYREALAGVGGVVCPSENPHERPAYHTFVIQADRRDELKRHLLSCGIESSIHYPVPIHLQSAAAGLGYAKGSFPVAEGQAGRILSLPVYPELQPQQLHAVVQAIKSFYA